jgi:hypothetical protein
MAERCLAAAQLVLDLVTAALPPGHRHPLSHQARWLYRTLHAAELAGLDPAEVIRTAITCRDLAGSRDIAAVIDARIRPRVYPLLPQSQGAWTGRVPRLPDPARDAYLAQMAAMMNDRTRRLRQHTAQTAPSWAVSALGPVPADSAARTSGPCPTGSCGWPATPTRPRPHGDSEVTRNRVAPERTTESFYIDEGIDLILAPVFV